MVNCYSLSVRQDVFNTPKLKDIWMGSVISDGDVPARGRVESESGCFFDWASISRHIVLITYFIKSDFTIARHVEFKIALHLLLARKSQILTG